MGADALSIRPDLRSLSVIVPTFGRYDCLTNCVTAIAKTAPWADVIVMDEGLTFSEHCNQGVAKADTEFICLLNDDTIPRPGWAEALMAPFEDPRVGITGAALFYPDGGIQHAGVYLDYPDGVLTAHNVITEEPSRSVEAVTGACMAVRAETWMQLGGMDEQFRNGYEDVDFCLRAREQGWRIWYAAESEVVHLESQSGQARWAHVGENIRLLHERWAGKLP